MPRTMPRKADGLLIGSRYEDQYTLERAWIDAGVARYRSLVARAVERGDAASLRASERLIVSWMSTLGDAVSRSHEAMRGGRAGKGYAVIADVATRIDAERTALIAVRRIVSDVLRTTDPSLASVAYAIGRDLVEQVHHDLYAGMFAADESAVGRVVRHCSPRVLRKWIRSRKVQDYWSIRTCGGLGLWLVELVVANCLVQRDGDEAWVPAFAMALSGSRRKRPSYVLRLSDEAAHLIEDGHSFRAFLRPRLAAMIVPPALWSDAGDGGYMSIRVPLVARQRRCHTTAMQAASPRHAWAGINAMAGVPWRINARLLSVIERCWQDGGSVAGMPAAEPTPIPPRPDGEDAVAAWKKEAASIHSANAKARSERFALLNAMQEARRLVGVAYWQPHQIDFRGRCYAMPLSLNHQMGDVPRSLFLFDQPTPLGDRGHWWLRVHAANCYGVDKCSFEDRIAWVEANSARIAEVAADPIRTIEWWQEADHPFQFVAACIALHDRDVAERLPVQMDGSANGLQHYAALGRDPVAAAAVNLRGGEPSDPYAAVLDRVRPIVARDAGDGNEHAIRVLPYTLRGVLKQTVMTVPYNVTRVGAGRQVRDNLKKAGMTGTAREIGGGAGYLSGVTLSQIGEVYSSAVRIMSWLERCTRAICHASRGNLVAWTTPRGLRVVQPYTHERMVRIRTQQYSIAFRAQGARNDPSAQVRGGPPNVVHSLDGDHMRSICIRAVEDGIPIAGVHDSVWSPAGLCDRVAVIIREEFVSLHSCDFVADLHAQWEREYGLTLEEPPARGDWDVAECLAAPYMFS